MSAFHNFLGTVVGLLVLLTCKGANAAEPARQYAEFMPCQWPQFDAAVQHFSEILQFHTVGNMSHPERADPVVWDLLDMWMREAYSEVFQAFEVEKLGPGHLSYLFTWKGDQPDLNPVLFVAHTDVVPVAPETLKDWTYPPFDGVVADGFVWGRGAMDVKILVVLFMEAASALLEQGFKPHRTLMFAFGHDEELMGLGAESTAQHLAARGVALDFIIDEGTGTAMDGLPPLFKSPIALVATAEKTYTQLQVTLRATGGHSSMPPVDGSSMGDRLGRFLSAMSSRPCPATLVHPTSDFLDGLGKLLPAGVSHFLSMASWLPPVRWLLAHLMTRVQAETAAMVRTTCAVTRLQAGTAENVLPQTASVGLNCRLLPGHTPEMAVGLVEGWLGKDAAHADVSIVGSSPPKIHVADSSSRHFDVVKAALQQHWRLDQPGSPAVPVLPVLMPGVTDSRHYMQLCPNGAARFTPWTARRVHRDYNRIHGVDERFRLTDFACALNTYKSMLEGFGLLGAADGTGSSARQSRGPAAADDDRSEL